MLGWWGATASSCAVIPPSGVMQVSITIENSTQLTRCQAQPAVVPGQRSNPSTVCAWMACAASGSLMKTRNPLV